MKIYINIESENGITLFESVCGSIDLTIEGLRNQKKRKEIREEIEKEIISNPF